MGRRSDTPGVEARPGGLRVYFRFQGRLCREPLALADTPANLKYAVRLVAGINDRIRHGTFDYAATFPNSKNITRPDSTLAAYIELWLGLQAHLAPSTRHGYRSGLAALSRLAHLPIASIKASQLGQTLLEQDWKNQKTRNNALTPIRGVFELARRDGLIQANPADELRFAKVQRPEPDPLTLEELDAVLAWLGQHRHEQTLNYFEFAFFSGMRTSELLGLEWGDIDWRRNEARVLRAVVEGELKESTKTAQGRNVELADRALAALRRQKAFTFMAGPGARVFHDPITGQPYVDDKPPRLQWTAALRALGMRHRAAYQTRHTYASLALMHGANAAWVAKQLGHASPMMTFRAYARWIEGADKGAEIAKLNAANKSLTTGNIRGTSRGISGTSETT